MKSTEWIGGSSVSLVAAALAMGQLAACGGDAGERGVAFAGSSWGNDQSRGPDLPSFFVLETISSPSPCGR